MNYVGCKVYSPLSKTWYPTVFYMNYVGCKVLGWLWQQWQGNRFYMNYVGCKVLIIFVLFDYSIRFI